MLQLSDGSCDSLPPDDASNSLKGFQNYFFSNVYLLLSIIVAKLSVTELWLKQHPFTNQDSVQHNGEVLCKGNYSMETLNLSCKTPCSTGG